MKKAISIILAVLVLLACAGCGEKGTDGETASGTESSGPAEREITTGGEELSGELVIKTCIYIGESDSITWLAREFEDLHPNVAVTFDYELDADENNALTRAERRRRRESFASQMRVELMSGEADYILYNVSDGLNLTQFAQSGVLLDLRPYWDGDPNINEDEYFMSALNAFAVDGKLTVLPLAFSFPGAFFDRTLLEERGVDTKSLLTVDSWQVLGWYESARESRKDLNLFFASPGQDELFESARYRYIDLENRTASFDSQEFVGFLERTRAALNDDPDLDPESEVGLCDSSLFNEQLRYRATGEVSPKILNWGGTEDNMFAHVVTRSRPAFASVEVTKNFLLPYLSRPMEYVAGPYPLVSSDGKLGLTSTMDFAVPSGCTDPDLAWEFIKYCISPRETANYSDLGSKKEYTSDIPLSKQNFLNNLEDYAQNGVPGAVSVEDLGEIDADGLLDKMVEILSQPLVNAKAYGVDVQEYLDEFYINELTTAEQCAEKIQDRTEIWLFE